MFGRPVVALPKSFKPLLFMDEANAPDEAKSDF
jgi:hypothetical protein